MSLVRSLRQRKTVLWIFTINVICCGAILLVLLDRRSSPYRSQQHDAFQRWKQNHDVKNAEKVHVLFKEEGSGPLDVHGRQMDKVMGIRGDASAAALSVLQKRQREEEQRIDAAMQSADRPLDYIPSVPAYSVFDVVPFINKSLTREYITIPIQEDKHKVLILTPICDVAHLIEGYVRALSELKYPHNLISVYFGEDSSSDRTFAMARLLTKDLVNKHGFHSADVVHLNHSGGIHGTWVDVHDKTSQFDRRSHLAKARNMLLKIGLEAGNFDYVLWIDSDVKLLPADMVQQLLFADADVVAPACLFQQGRYKKVFDKNSWRETPISIADQQKIPDDILIVEGYGHSFRIYLSDLKAEGRVVGLDGVGGCVLLVKATCHKTGLLFPEKLYNHHLETEGLAKLATDMGLRVRGMPWVEVFHN